MSSTMTCGTTPFVFYTELTLDCRGAWTNLCSRGEKMMNLALQTKQSASEITVFTTSIASAIEQMASLAGAGRLSMSHRFIEQVANVFTKLLQSVDANRSSSDRFNPLSAQV